MRIARSFLACSHPLVTPRSPSARAILFLFRVSPRFPHFAFASRPRLLLPFVGSVSSAVCVPSRTFLFRNRSLVSSSYARLSSPQLLRHSLLHAVFVVYTAHKHERQTREPDDDVDDDPPPRVSPFRSTASSTRYTVTPTRVPLHTTIERTVVGHIGTPSLRR